MSDNLRICELRKAALLVISAFYFIFSISFLFFQQPKNSLASSRGQLSSLPAISLNNSNLLSAFVSLIATETVASNSQHDLPASLSNVSIQKVYRHRQRYDLGSRSQYTKILLFAVFVLFAPLILAISTGRQRYNHFFSLFLPFPFFLSVTSLRI